MQVFADRGPLRQATPRSVFDDVGRLALHRVDDAVAFSGRIVREAARRYVGSGEHLAVGRVDRHGQDDHPVFGEMTAVAEHDLPDVADAETIDKDGTAERLADALDAR